MDHIFNAYTHFGIESNPIQIGNGNINDTFLVRGYDAQYILQRINPSVFKAPAKLIENHIFLQKYLKNQSYPFQTPQLLPNDWGASYTLDEKGDYWRLLAFCTADMPPFFIKSKTEVPNHNRPSAKVEIAYMAAFAFGLFDGYLSALPIGTIQDSIPNFHDTPLRWAVFENSVAADVCKRTAMVLPEIKVLTTWKPLFEHVFSLIKSGKLPLQVVHNDAKADNIIFDKSGAHPIAIIDWDTVMTGCVLADIGDLVRSLATNVDENHKDLEAITVNHSIINAIKSGFWEGLQTKSDKYSASVLDYFDLAAPWIIGEQALRFLTDYLQGDVYYKTEYADHNLVRARNQLRVLELIGF